MRAMLFAALLASALCLSISIAVLDFEPRGISDDQAVIITDILRTELLKSGRITIVEREKINALLKERQLSEVGVTESVELGKVLGVDKIIFGRIGKLGGSYVVTVRMIDVASGKVDFAEQYTCQMTTESITKVMKEIARVVQKYLPPIEGKVALREGDIVYITLSSKEGLKEGMELVVYRVEQVKDEEGNVIFEDVKEIGKIKVLKVSDKGSAAKVLSESVEIGKGDVVKLPLPQLSSEQEAAKAPAEGAKSAPPEREAVSPSPQPAASRVGTGYLKIVVENPKLLFKARIFIDGRPVPVPPEMMKEGVIYLENVPAGKRVIKITGPVIEDLVREVEVKKKELVEVKIKLGRAKGELEILTSPPNADIFINGKRISDKTPTILRLPVGRYRITLSKEGYQDENLEVIITKHRREKLSISLTPGEKGEIIVKEDFEDVPEGSLPKEFKVLYSGRWYGVVSGEVPAASGKKVLKVWGQPGWCCGLVVYFDIFKYKKIVFQYKVWVPQQMVIGGAGFINPDVSWGWICGGVNVHEDGTTAFWQSGNIIRKIKIYKVGKWNVVKTELYPKKRYIRTFVNGRLLYEQWIRSDGYSSHMKVYPPGEEPFEYDSIPKPPYNVPGAFSGLKGVHFGDCPGEIDDIPTYFDDVLIVGYK